MRLIVCLLSLGLLSTGCAFQAGDPSADEADRIDGVVSQHGDPGTERTVLPAEKSPNQVGSLPDVAPASPATHGRPVATPAAAGGQNGSDGVEPGDPNPSPWWVNGQQGQVQTDVEPKGSNN
jgi:hypothetical protein